MKKRMNADNGIDFKPKGMAMCTVNLRNLLQRYVNFFIIIRNPDKNEKLVMAIIQAIAIQRQGQSGADKMSEQVV